MAESDVKFILFKASDGQVSARNIFPGRNLFPKNDNNSQMSNREPNPEECDATKMIVVLQLGQKKVPALTGTWTHIPLTYLFLPLFSNSAVSFLNTTVLSKTSTNTGCSLSISPARMRLDS